ncbi:MAG: tRNA-dihydrouridine synthase [Nitrospiraceae bacterium]
MPQRQRSLVAAPEHLLDVDELERPVVAQLYGKDPELFYRAAQVVCELGFDGLDINGLSLQERRFLGVRCGADQNTALAQAIMRSARQGIEDWAGDGTWTRQPSSGPADRLYPHVNSSAVAASPRRRGA